VVDSEARKRVKPELPRLVEQLRVLLWMQMHASLLGVLVLIILAAVAANRQFAHPGAATDFADRVLLAAAALSGVAAVLAICAKLLWRGWPWLFVLILATEAAVVVIIVRAVTSGLLFGLAAVLYAGLTAWILADLFRPEVLTYLLRRRPAGQPVSGR